MRLTDYERRIGDHEEIARALATSFWIAIAVLIGTIAFAPRWLCVILLLGVCAIHVASIYWSALAGFGRGSLSAIEKGITKEDYERYVE